MKKDEIPAEQDEHREVGIRDGLGLDLDSTIGLDQAVASLDPDQWLVAVLPDPLGLPEVRRREANGAAVRKLQGAASYPAWMKNREIGFGPSRADGDARLPETLAFEGPVTASSLSIGQRSTLKPDPGDDLIARAQLVLALKGGGLDPEQLVVGHLGNRSH